MITTVKKTDLSAALQFFKKLRANEDAHVQPLFVLKSNSFGMMGGVPEVWDVGYPILIDPAGEFDSGHFRVDVDQMIRAIRSLDNGRLMLSTGYLDAEKLQVVDESGASVFVPTTSPVIETPNRNLNEEEYHTHVDMSADILLEGLTFVSEAAGKEKTRPTLGTIFIEYMEDGRLRLTATNSWVLSQWNYQLEPDPDAPFEDFRQEWWKFSHKSHWAALNAKAIEPLFGLLKKHKTDPVELYFMKDGSLHIDIIGTGISYRRTSDTSSYPNYEYVHPDFGKNDTATWNVHPRELLDVINKAKQLKGRLDFSISEKTDKALRDMMLILVEETSDLAADSGQNLKGRFEVPVRSLKKEMLALETVEFSLAHDLGSKLFESIDNMVETYIWMVKDANSHSPLKVHGTTRCDADFHSLIMPIQKATHPGLS